MTVSIGVAIVGAGLIGLKRAGALSEFKKCRLVVSADINTDSVEKLSGCFGGDVETDWQSVVNRPDVDVVIVSVYNKYLAPITIAALENKKHVLCEKPLGCNAAESRRMMETARNNGVLLKTGFNHRYHPAIAKGRQIVEEGSIGELLTMRCAYGHGGRPGYEKEWRADRDLSGGGELLDQGVHVVDLFRWFAGDFDRVFGCISRRFWPVQVEDNAFAIFRQNSGLTASMHTSWTQWKNLFLFEVYGSDGYLVVNGLGGSYGTETLRTARRNAKGGRPDEKVMEFTGPDISWRNEWREFISAIEQGREPAGNGWDGYQANRMIDAVYKSAETDRFTRI